MSVTEPLVGEGVRVVPSFTLESGMELEQVPVAYKTWGQLSATRDNVVIIRHAFTGSADVEDWSVGTPHGLREGFRPTILFCFCANVLGLPYGTASHVTMNPYTRKSYGPEFSQTTIRDDVRSESSARTH
ncbi:hypothetical protein BKA83DRAFT_4055939 [Pisolithus microcarpus]|nr:hypothetical protein BKA83DRAFT_4055939 [Pisolithus microcarpus]